MYNLSVCLSVVSVCFCFFLLRTLLSEINEWMNLQWPTTITITITTHSRELRFTKSQAESTYLTNNRQIVTCSHVMLIADVTGSLARTVKLTSFLHKIRRRWCALLLNRWLLRDYVQSASLTKTMSEASCGRQCRSAIAWFTAVNYSSSSSSRRRRRRRRIFFWTQVIDLK